MPAVALRGESRLSPAMRRRRAPLAIAAVLLSAAAMALLWALVAGDLPVAATDVFAALAGAEGMGATVIRELRLPRALAAFACGGLLATAGALMQVLLRNPLADPYILGISGGAAVGALGAMMLGAALFWVDVSAFAGALAAMLLVFGLAHGDGSWTQTRLLLTGVIVAAGCGAAVSLMLALAPDTRVMSMLFWMMGDASAAARPWPALAVLALALVVVMPFARDLNVLARGELSARALGVRVGHLRVALYVLASLLTATAVTLVGSVGFVGLVVPHLVRLALGNDQRVLIPAAALAGGTLLTLADTAARTVMAPQQLPVGVLTALIGVPVFLFLLSRSPRRTP
jgi:iron complex transport system permease protein